MLWISVWLTRLNPLSNDSESENVALDDDGPRVLSYYVRFAAGIGENIRSVSPDDVSANCININGLKENALWISAKNITTK